MGILVLGFLFCFASVHAADRLESWKRLGEKLVDHKVARDEIDVGADESEGVFGAYPKKGTVQKIAIRAKNREWEKQS